MYGTDLLAAVRVPPPSRAPRRDGVLRRRGGFSLNKATVVRVGPIIVAPSPSLNSK